MSLTSDFYSHLIGDSELSAAVGDDGYGTPKIYHQQVPQGTAPPFLYFALVSGRPVHHYGAAAPLSSALYQIDCVGDSDTDDAFAIGEAVRNLLDGRSSFTMGSTEVQGMFLESEREITEDTDDASETWIVRRIQDFEVWYVSTVPTG